MKLFNKLRQFFGNYDYRRRASGIDRNKKTVNIEDAQKIGLLYLVPDERSYEKIVDFIKNLQKQGKKVFALGFVMNKDVPSFFSSSNSYSFFTLKDLNWYNKPRSTFVTNFLNEKFDLVINLSLEDIFPLQYISGLSKANMRVGKYGEDNGQYYDMMIETDKINDLGSYIEQIAHYLSIIKNKSGLNDIPSKNQKKVFSYVESKVDNYMGMYDLLFDLVTLF